MVDVVRSGAVKEAEDRVGGEELGSFGNFGGVSEEGELGDGAFGDMGAERALILEGAEFLETAE